MWVCSREIVDSCVFVCVGHHFSRSMGILGNASDMGEYKNAPNRTVWMWTVQMGVLVESGRDGRHHRVERLRLRDQNRIYGR